MQASNFNKKQQIDLENSNQSEESQIFSLPQLRKLESSQTEEQESQFKYVKVSKKNETIDEEAILQEFRKQEEVKQPFSQKLLKRKKIKKVGQVQSQKYRFGNINKKAKAQIEGCIEKYKQYINLTKKSYDAKEKEYLLDFYKVLLDGIYELKTYSEDSTNDLTPNENRIIAPNADFSLYLRDLVQQFDQTFREAKAKGIIHQTKIKWDPLIKNCKDKTNFELRRKIIRAKIKPIHVIENNDEFLMSEETKLKDQRRQQLILNEAAKDFKSPFNVSEQISRTEEVENLQGDASQLQSQKSLPSISLERKISEQRQKLEQYKFWIGDEPILLIKKRINETLLRTPSYDKIMKDFLEKFPQMQSD